MGDLMLLSDRTVLALGWTLIHAVWQGTIAAALLWVARHFVKTPNVRYVMACGALAALVAMPAATLLATLPEPADPIVTWTSEVIAKHPGPPLTWETSEVYQPDSRPVFLEATDGWISLSARFQHHLPVIVFCWQIGVLLLSLRLIGGSWFSHHLKWSGTTALPDEWQARVAALVKRLNVRHKVNVVTSSVATIPMVVGVFRPVILIPIATFLGLSHRQLEAILIHELAHVRRYDNLVNLFQRFAETVLFFHPAVWWISSCIREERERCCDDVVIAHSDRKVYAEALVALEGFRTPILAAAATGGSLLTRVKRLLAVDGTGERRGWGRLTMTNLVSVVATIVFAVVMIETTQDTGAASDKSMNVAVDVTPTKPHVGTTLCSTLSPLLGSVGQPKWSMARLQGVLGHAFHFEMKPGGGPVMHDNLDWGDRALKKMYDIVDFRSFNANKNWKTKGIDRPAVEREARDAVRETLDRGVPALVWQPMSVEQKKNGYHAYCWGLIVGYNEPDETYTIRHPFMPDDYTVRYDAIGYTDGAQWFNVKIFEKLSDKDEKTTHVEALQNALASAKGERYKRKKSSHGFAAYETWRKALESKEVPLEPSRYHAEILKGRRLAAAAYARELVTVFPEAKDPLEAAATQYDREVAALEPLYDLLETARDREAITSSQRAEARRLIGEALAADRAAVARIEAVLAVLPASPAGESEGVESPSPSGEAHSRKILDVKPSKAFTRAVSALHSTLQAAGATDWSTARLMSVLGNAFSFEMRKGGGKVWQEANTDWWQFLPGLDLGVPVRRIETWDRDALRSAREAAWDAVRASIDRGVPATGMVPMNPDPGAPSDWGSIVGYDESDGTYAVRRHGLELDVRYDEIGIPDGGFCVLVHDPAKAGAGEATHLSALKNAVRFAYGTRFPDQAHPYAVDARGFAAFELWRDAIASNTPIPKQRGPGSGGIIKDSRYNTEELRELRKYAATYCRELEDTFPAASRELGSAAAQYDRVVEAADGLVSIFDRAKESGEFTSDARAEAARLIDKALIAERQAIARIENALGTLGVSTKDIERTSTGEESAMNVMVDVTPDRRGDSLPLCLSPLMRATGHPEWTRARTEGVLGHAFQFDMKEGGKWVLHDNLDWGAAVDLLPSIARFQEFNARQERYGRRPPCPETTGSRRRSNRP